MTDVWFESWGRVGALAVALVAAYAWLVVVLRVSGKRTLAKLSAFDFAVTIALGSTLATVSASEVAAAVRKEGFASLRDVACVVLETDGTFSVLERLGDLTAVVGVDGSDTEYPDRLVGTATPRLRRDTPGREV